MKKIFRETPFLILYYNTMKLKEQEGSKHTMKLQESSKTSMCRSVKQNSITKSSTSIFPAMQTDTHFFLFAPSLNRKSSSMRGRPSRNLIFGSHPSNSFAFVMSGFLCLGSSGVFSTLLISTSGLMSYESNTLINTYVLPHLEFFVLAISNEQLHIFSFCRNSKLCFKKLTKKLLENNIL